MKLYMAVPLSLFSRDIRVSTNLEALKNSLPNDCNNHYLYELNSDDEVTLSKEIVIWDNVKFIE